MQSYVIIALNQTILLICLIIIPVIVSIFINPTGNILVNIAIAFLMDIPILARLIVYTKKTNEEYKNGE